MAGLGAGCLLDTGASAMSGLQSGSACRLAADLLDHLAHIVGTDLSEHAHRISTAAEHYRYVDESYSRTYRAIAE